MEAHSIGLNHCSSKHKLLLSSRSLTRRHSHLPYVQNRDIFSVLCKSHRRVECSASSTESNDDSGLIRMDSNELQTALNSAIASEDYARAARLRNILQKRRGEGEVSMDWHTLGVLEWLAERAGQLGCKFPTEIQRRACLALRGGCQDVVLQSETGSGKTLGFLLPLLSILDYPPKLYPEDLPGPQLVVVVPSMELGVQEAMLVYKIFGGSVNPGIPGASANMFAYTGPRGLKVRGILNDEEVLLAKTIGYLKGAHVVVATPEKLAEIIRLPEFRTIFQGLKAVAVDEVDACFKEYSETMEKVMTAACAVEGRAKPVVVFAGATLHEDLAEQAAQMGWLEDPVRVESGSQARIPRGLQHRYITVAPGEQLIALCRHVRADMDLQGEDAPPPRVIVFTDSEESASAVADPLRTALWDKHRLAVLLPHGKEPIKAMHAFRDNKASLLVATSAAARGLDLPAVSHVYNLGCPDKTSYLHRAGRAGRIGSPVRGLITTILSPEQEAEMKQIAEDLQIELEHEDAIDVHRLADPEEDLPSAKRGLEDLYNLM